VAERLAPPPQAPEAPVDTAVVEHLWLVREQGMWELAYGKPEPSEQTIGGFRGIAGSFFVTRFPARLCRRLHDKQESAPAPRIPRVENPMKRTITIDDLFRIKLLASPQIAPDGEQVVFVYKWIDTEKTNTFPTCGRVRIGEEAQPFTYGEWSDSQPRWSPDGKQIAFVSSRQKPKTQIYVIPADGGEARPITNLEEGSIGSFAWSPDGTRDCLHLSRDRP
jgi:hypothetical protein